MSFETNKFQVVKKKRLQKSEFNVECNVPLNCEIEKIFSVCHNAKADNAEVLNGIVNYNGSVDLCVLYQSVDGEVGTTSCTCPFVSKFEDATINVNDKVGIEITVSDYSIESIGQSSIKINCLLLQKAVLISNKDVENVSAGDEDVCYKEEEIVINTFVGQNSEIFTIESVYTIKEPVKKVLLCDTQVCVKDVESGVNFVAVSGELISKILYLTENEKYESAYITENFKEEVELEGVTRESISEAIAFVERSQIKCDVENQDKGVNVNLTVPVGLKVTAYEEKPVNIIKDIYSTCNELEVSTESFEMTKQLPSDYFEAKIDGSLTLDEDKPRVDKVLFVGGTNLSISNAYVQNGEIFVEGVAKANVVYLNDETNSNNSVTVEVPFVVSDKSMAECDSPEITISAILFDVDVVVKKGREFYFDGKLKINVSYDCDNVSAIISNINISGTVEEKDCAVELVFASSGMSAWDIAKSLKVKEETLLNQNPDITFPLEQDDNVVVYYQKLK